MKRYVENLLIYLIVMMIILNSGTIYFTYKNGKVSLIILFALSIILFLWKKKANFKNAIIWTILGCGILVNTMINSVYNVQIVSIINFIVKLFFIMIICNNLEMNQFKEKYINIMCIIAIISLYCFTFCELNLQEYVLFDLKSEVLDGMSNYIYTPYYTVGWYSSFHRNAGIFWEPGAYAIFINIAILMLVDRYDYIKKSKSKLILLVITSLTTKSTSGYIVLVIISSIVLIRKYNSYTSKRKKLKWMIIALITSVTISAIFINSEVITNKFEESNDSYNIRINDFYSSIDIIKSRPFWGYGLISTELEYKQTIRNINSNSNGILYLGNSLGIIYAGMFFFIIFINLKNIFTKLNRNIVFIIFIIINLSEVLFLMPISYVFLFKFKENEIFVEGV